MKYIIRIIIVAATVISVNLTVAAAYIGKSYNYNDYGETIPSPDAYLAAQVLAGEGIGCGSLNKPQDLYVASDDNIYIADTGNNRILIISPDLKLVKEITQLTNTITTSLLQPSGLFVDRQGNIYICDTGNSRAVKIDISGRVIHEYLKPDSQTLDEDFVFKPLKIAADSAGGVYIIAYGMYQGLISYDNDGTFLNFYGSNKVEATLSVIADNMWKKLFTKSQRESMGRTIPTEYSNIVIDEKNFIYTTTLKTESSVNEVKKLNALGNNILRFNAFNTYYAKNNFGDIDMEWSKGQRIDNVFVDLTVGSDGIMALLDKERCRIYEYSKENDLILIYGNKGSKKGEFLNPTAIGQLDGNYLVLDADKGTITVLVPTAYTQELKAVMKLYSDGLYEESIDGFTRLLSENNNLSIAYKGIGKAYLQKEEYRTALTYFRKANDKQGYSEAFNEYRKIFLRQHLLLIAFISIMAIILAGILIKKFSAWLLAGRNIKA
ncbi:MAG: NHL repeat-containing protein [Saccharofermentanales bacterium]